MKIARRPVKNAGPLVQREHVYISEKNEKLMNIKEGTFMCMKCL
jgi:hypothetical protein